MRRYRKGELFRPPTAAESAANADALEGYRRRPSQPPNRQVRGRIHIGKLDAALEYDDADGVTVSIWRGKPAVDSGEDIPGVVVSELFLTSGQLNQDDPVVIQWIDGRWYVTETLCE